MREAEMVCPEPTPFRLETIALSPADTMGLPWARLPAKAVERDSEEWFQGICRQRIGRSPPCRSQRRRRGTMSFTSHGGYLSMVTATTTFIIVRRPKESK
jgi:hypothetical protein